MHSLPGSPRDLTPDTFTAWAQTLHRLTPTVRRNHLRIVRNLCLYRGRTEPACFVPDLALFPARHQPRAPYIFTIREIAQLVRATATLPPAPQSPLRPRVFRLAVVLLYTTGPRRGELLRLTLADYARDQPMLLIREMRPSSTTPAGCRCPPPPRVRSTATSRRGASGGSPWPIVAGSTFTTAELHPHTVAALDTSPEAYRLSFLRYDLSKLRAKGLVVPHSRRYRLLPEGYRICLVFLKLFERIYAPFTAGLLQPVAADIRLRGHRISQLDKLYQRVVEALDRLLQAVGLKAA